MSCHSERKRRIFLGGLAVLLLGYLFCLPRNLFKDIPCSTVVYSAEGELLGARIADDQQWRFPPCDTVPSRYAKAVVRFEDRHFYWHPGVNPVSLVRALIDNIRSGHVVSGGSTLTMQVVRLSRQRERTVWQKMIEAVLATRMEFRYTKREILALYASYAPFGGNVVGLEAASWRYFGRPAGELSWGEAATLAVLPNAPASMHPGRNRDALLEKRNRLLAGLLEHGDIDQDSYEAALSEPLPDAPLPLPSYAPHFVESCPRGVQTHSTLKYSLQRAVETAVNRKSDEMAREGVADMAAVVIDNASGDVVAYVGNASPDRDRPGKQVDIASSPRSTGSILKPFLYAAALQDGVILPETLLPDIPVNLGGFAPQNFDRQFYGAVLASEALARSLNVPAVFLLRSYGVPRFHELLQRCGLTTLGKDASYYGLSLILGGGEGRLDEITRAYSGLVRTYCHSERSEESPIQDKIALWYTFEALKEVNRPDEL
ncbi:MAG: penicillin-binding protein 1C, partial [Bacteroidales bacterium]|nr:penicillin-binding protein 1C [Bacteroidales bacterium]